MHGNIKSFEKPFTRAEVVALAERTLKRFGGDRNMAGRYARSMEDRYESAKWAQVVEVLATSGRQHATKKTPPAQLKREIAEALARPTGSGALGPLIDGPDGLNEAAFDQALGSGRKRTRVATVPVLGLQDGQHTAGTKFLIGKIKDLGAKVVLASTGRVSIVSATGERCVYTLELDRRLVDDSRMAYPSVEVQARLRAANSPLTQALADLMEVRS